MNKKLYWLCSCILAMVLAVAFVACENQKKNFVDDEDDDEEVVTPKQGYSIIGTWKMTQTSAYYENESFDIYLTFKADNTGTYTVNEYDYEPYTFNLAYSYDPSTCLGELVMIDPYYGAAADELSFKLKWYGPDQVMVYIRDSYYNSGYYYEDEYEQMGMFYRQ